MSLVTRRSTLVAECIHEISKMIREGKFAAGEFLPSQKQLASDFGVGVGTVREALQALAAMGLLESHPGKGTWVRDKPYDALRADLVSARIGEMTSRQLQESRQVIEVALTEFAAKRATQQDLAKIMGSLEAMRANLEDPEGFATADVRFHMAVAEAAHNDFLKQFYELIREFLSEAVHVTSEIREVREDGLRMQEEIAKHIGERDPVEAKKAAEKLMQYVEPLFVVDEQRE